MKPDGQQGANDPESGLRVTSVHELPSIVVVDEPSTLATLGRRLTAVPMLIIGGSLSAFVAVVLRSMWDQSQGPAPIDPLLLSEAATRFQIEVMPLVLGLALALTAVPRLTAHARAWSLTLLPSTFGFLAPGWDVEVFNPLALAGVDSVIRAVNVFWSPWTVFVALLLYAPAAVGSLRWAARRLAASTDRSLTVPGERFALLAATAAVALWAHQSAPPEDRFSFDGLGEATPAQAERTRDTSTVDDPAYDGSEEIGEPDAGDLATFRLSDDVDGLNLRAGPSLDDAVVGVLEPEHTPLEATGEIHNDGERDWRELIMEDGVTGWASDRYLDRVS